MALTQVASPLDTVVGVVSSFAKSSIEFFEEVGRARAARVLYAELSGMSDAELDELGLKRDQIARKVYAKVYDLR